MSVTKLSLGVLQRVSEFLAELPEDQLTDLAEGRARLAYVPEGTTEPAPRARATKRTAAASQPSEATKALIERLEALGSREAATTEAGDIKTADLRAIGKALNVPRYSGMKVDDLRREIVDATVGRRLDSIATRGFDGLRP
jgi:hypothetical protein